MLDNKKQGTLSRKKLKSPVYLLRIIDWTMQWMESHLTGDQLWSFLVKVVPDLNNDVICTLTNRRKISVWKQVEGRSQEDTFVLQFVLIMSIELNENQLLPVTHVTNSNYIIWMYKIVQTFECCFPRKYYMPPMYFLNYT